ncbi:MAG: hypothetical protein M5U26_29360 [Planctomycetota bacterium]|nr:hypothetical protein [Planctomycetota bacterium]
MLTKDWFLKISIALALVASSAVHCQSATESKLMPLTKCGFMKAIVDDGIAMRERLDWIQREARGNHDVLNWIREEYSKILLRSRALLIEQERIPGAFRSVNIGGVIKTESKGQETTRYTLDGSEMKQVEITRGVVFELELLKVLGEYPTCKMLSFFHGLVLNKDMPNEVRVEACRQLNTILLEYFGGASISKPYFSLEDKDLVWDNFHKIVEDLIVSDVKSEKPSTLSLPEYRQSRVETELELMKKNCEAYLGSLKNRENVESADTKDQNIPLKDDD